MESTNSAPNGRLKRPELLQYYDVADNTATIAPPVLDLHCPDFDPMLYAQKFIKECSLKQVLDEEVSLSSTAHRLDSDCQTLVYEHYDKFLQATDLVHKLKEGSSEMEDQLQKLQTNMALITSSCSAITSGLQDRQSELSQLLAAHTTLNKLEFLFQLPDKMDECIERGDLEEGVQCYLNTREVLQRYQHLPSLTAVRAECHEALGRLQQALHTTMAKGSSQSLASCSEQLLLLGESPAVLRQRFLTEARARLEGDLTALRGLAGTRETGRRHSIVDAPLPDDGRREEVQDGNFEVDLLVFIERCHDSFVATLWLFISSYQQLFLQSQDSSSEASSDLSSLVDASVTSLLSVVRLRVSAEVSALPLRCRVMAAALDKLHRRLRALETIMKRRCYTQWSLDLILEATDLQCAQCLAALKLGLENTLTDVRQGIASSPTLPSPSLLPSLLSHLVANTAADIKKNLEIIMAFLTGGATYSSDDAFRLQFVILQARERTVVAFLRHIAVALAAFAGSADTALTSADAGADTALTNADAGVDTCTEAAADEPDTASTSDEPPVPSNTGCGSVRYTGPQTATSPSLLLVLARAAWDLHTSTAHYLLRECDDSLEVPKLLSQTPVGAAALTAADHITGDLRGAAQQLLDAYVARQGTALAQLLVRSVELKDWLTCGEPRSVRRVVRTVREDIEACEVQVGSLYEEGARKERSSDSSRRTYHSLIPPSLATSHPSAPSLHLSKLWCDRIEVYVPVRPDRLSVVSGIVKIALKSLEESLRLRTLSTYGLQQVQVDTHYLRTHLWRHVADDSLLNALLDAVLTAAALRCRQPRLMERSVVEFLCGQ